MKILPACLALTLQPRNVLLPVDQKRITEDKQAVLWPLLLVNKIFHLVIKVSSLRNTHYKLRKGKHNT